MLVHAQSVNYPLNIGDVWQYRYITIPIVDSTVYSYKAVSDTFINGNEYTVILFTNYQYNSYERQSGDSVFVYKSAYNREFLYFDFSRTASDTVSSTSFGSDTMDVALRQIYVGNYFGSLRRSWVFYVNQSRQSIDDEYTVVVTDSFGITQVVPDFGDPQHLVGAIINGKVYGTIDAVRPDGESTPREFLFSQNFPNPFNPKTTIRFALPQSSPVTIGVYNVVGQLVQTFQYSRLTAGSHDAHFDATILPTGTYIYRITTVVGTKSGKMLLAK